MLSALSCFSLVSLMSLLSLEAVLTSDPLVGFSLMIPNVTMSAYLIDCFRKKGASVTACNNFVRYIMAGIGSLVASDIQRALGSGILYTICGAALLLFSILLVILRMKGKEWAIKRKEQGY